MCSVGSVWEWLNEWIDDSDLPKLQSIQLDRSALDGDCRDKDGYHSYPPANYNLILTMKSGIEWSDEWIDLPSLTHFNGNGNNFRFIGSVILESSHIPFDWTRYPSIIK